MENIDYNKEKSIAFLGNISEKKGPFLLLHAFKAIYDFDNEFTLHIAGKMQSPRVAATWDYAIPKLGLSDAIHYYDFVNDPLSWLKGFTFFINSSPLEGHCVSFVQALSVGLHPLLHNHVGADLQYPRSFIWQTIPELVEMIQRPKKDPQFYIDFVKENYSKAIQFEKIDKEIEALLNSPPKKKLEIKKSTVAAVMAVKNGSKTIEKALNSLIKQGYPLEKIIVVDDGSTDNTVDIVNKINAKSEIPIEVISISPSKWVFSARNEGVKLISSDYMFFLDADDIIEQTFVEELSKVLDANPTIDIIYPDILHFNEKNETQEFKVPDFDPQILTARNFIAYCSLQRTKRFKEIGGYSQYLNDSRNHLSEWEFWLRCLKAGFKFQHIPKTLFHYFKSGNSTQMSGNYEISRECQHLQMATTIMGGSNNIQMNADKERIMLVCQGKDYLSRSSMGFELMSWAKPLEMDGKLEVYCFQYDVEMQYFGQDKMQERLKDYIKLIQPKYIFHPTYKDTILPSTWKEISEKYCTIAWNSDEWRYDEFNKEYDKNFQHAITTYPSVFEKMNHSGKILSQWAANQFYFYPREKDIEVSFTGQANQNRKELLAGLDVECYGLNFPNGFVDFTTMASVLSRSKISLSFSMGVNGRQLKLRPFEITASRALCICEQMPGIEQYFIPGKEIVLFDTKQELDELVMYYTKHSSEAKKIALAGYERTVKDHLWTNRFKTVFEEIDRNKEQPNFYLVKKDEIK